MNQKMPLDGCIYTLTVGRVLNIIVSQISLGYFLFTATLRVRLGSCLSTALKMDNLDCTKINAHFKKIHSLSTGGAHSRLLVHIASPTSPPYGQVENAEVRKPKYGNGSMETEIRK